MFHPRQKRPFILVPGASTAELGAAEQWLASLLRLPRFAHHPACGYWSNHLIKLGGVPFCLGCFCMALGVGLGMLVVYPLIAPTITAQSMFLVGVLCYLPTPIQIYVQRYAFKILARFVLGIGVVLSLGAALFGYSWASMGAAWNVAFLAVFVILLVGTLRWRARHLDVPCLRCDEGRFPFCSWRVTALRDAVDRHDRGENSLPEGLTAFVRTVIVEIESEAGSKTRHVQFVNVNGCETPSLNE